MSRETQTQAIYTLSQLPKRCHGLAVADRIPLHGVSRTARISQRTNPIMPAHSRSLGPKPLPINGALLVQFPSASLSGSPTSSNEATSPSSCFTSASSSCQSLIDGIDSAFKTAEEHTRAMFSELRISCTQAVMEEHKHAERLRAQSLEYLRERNFAWAKMKALLAEKQQNQQDENLPGLRRSRSLGRVPDQVMKNRSARSKFTAKQARSLSPTLPPLLTALSATASLTPTSSASASPPLTGSNGPYLSQSISFSNSTSTLASSVSGADVEIKKEDVQISLSTLPSSSRSISPISPSETFVDDSFGGLLHPGQLLNLDRSTPKPKFTPNANLFVADGSYWLRRPNGGAVRLYPPKQRPEYLAPVHFRLIFKNVYRHYVCRMCILERSKLKEDKRADYLVAVFDHDSEEHELHMHINRHTPHIFDLANLTELELEQVKQGFAKTERDEDFLEYIRAGGA